MSDLLRESRKDRTVSADAARGARVHALLVPEHTYAVAWRENRGSPYIGKLVLRAADMRLHGRAPAGVVMRTIRYAEISSLGVERYGGHRVVSVRVGARFALEIDSLDRAGSLAELSEELRRRARNVQGDLGAAPMTARG